MDKIARQIGEIENFDRVKQRVKLFYEAIPFLEEISFLNLILSNLTSYIRKYSDIILRELE